MDIIEKAIRAGEIAKQIKSLKDELEALFYGADDADPVDVDPPSALVSPSKDEAIVEAVAQATTLLSAPAGEPPRKRGRPPGSTNKPKPAPTLPVVETPGPVVSAPPVDDIPWGGDGETENVTETPSTETSDDNEDVF